MATSIRPALALLAAGCLGAAALEAAIPPRSAVATKAYRHPALSARQRLVPPRELPAHEAAPLARNMAALGLSPQAAFYDPLGARLASLVVSEPLVPGAGNALSWDALGGRPPDEAALREHLWAGVLAWLDRQRAVLRVDAGELAAPAFGVFDGGELVHVWSRRVMNAVPVREASVTAVINHGNLVLLGLENWGDAPDGPAQARTTADEARVALARHLEPHAAERFAGEPLLEYVPVAADGRYAYRLAWVVRLSVRGDTGSWEGLVDAGTGELLAFEDTNQYATRRAVGGVYPVSNDQRPPDGIEQPGWPLPFLDVATPTGTLTTTTGGTIGCVSGTVSTMLRGRAARINDACGAVNESSAGGDLDLSFGPTPDATDCVVPPGHSAGDTKAARTAFYELTRVNEQARGYLPANAWLQTPLQANVNVNLSCGAFWNPSGVTFYRGGAACRNVGEIASIVDHEWGHGMDANGVNPNISNPAEAVADVHAFLRTAASCVGRGLFRNQVCGGYGDQCVGDTSTGCTGPRDIDFAGHVCGRPHTITWVLSGFPAGHCVDGVPRPACPSGTNGPCGRLGHCEGHVLSETFFDLARRDLPAAGLDANTSHELTTRLFFLASQAATGWYTCSVGGSCSATNGYLLTLAADDDDGNIANGTPHMTAIRAAFERHQIHCATPAPADSGCAGGPATAPVVTATPFDQGVALTWNAVPGAARYAVYRTEGVNGDAFGKAKVGEVAGTAFADSGLQNGRQYYYLVLPVGTNGACFGRMSAAASVVPAAGPGAAITASQGLSVSGGDGDPFLDNCELGTLTFTVENTGSGTLTGVRLVNVVFVSHPTSILQTPLPAPIAATLAECGRADGSFAFMPRGLAPEGTMQVRVDVTADQLGGQVVSRLFTITDAELDRQFAASRTFDFDAGLQGWTAAGGTWTRQTPGAQGTSHHVSSSENAPDACDVLRSPRIVLRAASTLALYNRYQIEPNGAGGPRDRANVGVRDLATGLRTVIVPSGGQLYTNPPGGTSGTCEQVGQPGWNGGSATFPAFEVSTWSAAALNPGGMFTDRLVHLEIRYGTDSVTSLSGFDFDQATLTGFDEFVPDTQPDTCLAQAVAPLALAVDGGSNSVLEPGETAAVAPTWRNAGTQAITASGATSNFTGPAGPVYSNPDASASYGTIAVGGSSSCSSTGDCYTVSVAGARPLTHWDATIEETITPTSTAHTWTLHVGASFGDVPPASPFYPFVERVLHNGVTGGCAGDAYCPAASTTRQQMAVFVLLAKEGAGYQPPACVAGSETFADVPASSPFCRWIEELARRGVVGGCGGDNYCPDGAVTREQLAVFVLRTLDPALDPPACAAGAELFADVPASSPFCRWIEELFRRGVVAGCGGGNYCPAAAVTREQMSVFLTVTFGLLLYAP